ncbi:hypothetical protein Tco_0435464 [Tanacetum coccineum]
MGCRWYIIRQASINHGGTPAQTRSEKVLKQPNKPPFSEGHTSGSREGSMEQTFELTDNALDLEKGKDAQAVEILNLKRKVKKLERKRKSSISHPRKRTYIQVETSSDDDLDEEDASKQGRRKETVDAAATGVSTVSAPISTAGVTIDCVEQRTPLQQNIVLMRGYKGKGVLVEEEPVKIKMRDQGDLQVQADAELAQRIHEEELAELERAQQRRLGTKMILICFSQRVDEISSQNR